MDKFTVFWIVVFLMAAISYVQHGEIRPFAQTGESTYETSYTSSNVSPGASWPENARAGRASPSALANSPYRGQVVIENFYANANPNQEYISLLIKNKSGEPLPISGWQVKSLSSGKSRPVPNGVILPSPGSLNAEQTIYARNGERVFLVSGRSPTGFSFKVNTCSGYFSQVQTFTPYLPSECPRPDKYELPAPPNHLNDRCLDYLETLPVCFLPTQTVPQDLNQECQGFIASKYNYNSCVFAHKNNPNFYKPEWRVYLNAGESLWKNRREHIQLLDQDGKLITSLVY